MTTFDQSARRYLDWISHEAIPLWGTTGLGAHGGSVERLDSCGKPDLEAPLRVRVQARQLFAFSAAAQRGWHAEAQGWAASVNQFMQRYGLRDQQPGYWHLLSPDLVVSDQRIDLYDYAFFMLSRAWALKVLEDPDAHDQAKSMFALLESRLQSEHGGWLEGDYTATWRRQNPHMHLLETFLTLSDFTGDAIWLDAATRVMALFDAHFFRPREAVLFEYFDADWTSAADSQRVEPGHMLEWVWLLHWYESRTGRSYKEKAAALYENALRLGLSGNGTVLDTLDQDGRPIALTKRLWPMTEFIKASVCEGIAGREAAWGHAADGIDALHREFLSDEIKGAYIDRLGDNDDVIDDRAPASSMYHLVAAALEVERGLNFRS